MTNLNSNSDEQKPSLDIALVNEITRDNLKDVFAEGGEVPLDLFFDEGILKDIPFLGVLYKLGKVIGSVRDGIFAKKIYKFLFELKDIPYEKRKKFIEKIEQDENFQEKVGEKLIVLIEQLDDMDKPQIIGRLFKATINENITSEEFLRLSSIVNKSFLPDLKKLKAQRDSEITQIVEEQFVSIGIYSMTIKEEIFKMASWTKAEREKKISSMKYTINDMGRKLIEFGLK